MYVDWGGMAAIKQHSKSKRHVKKRGILRTGGFKVPSVINHNESMEKVVETTSDNTTSGSIDHHDDRIDPIIDHL